MTEDMDKEMRKLDKKYKKEEAKSMDVVVDMENEISENIEELKDYVNIDDAEYIENSETNVLNTEINIEKLSDEDGQNSAPRHRAKQKEFKKVAIIVTFAIIFIMFAVIIGVSLSNKLSSNVYKGVYLENKNLSGMNEVEVLEYVRLRHEEIKKRTVKVEQEDNFLIEIDSSDFGLEIDEAKTVENVMRYGRSQNIIKDNIDIFIAMFNEKNIDIVYTYSDSKLLEIIKEVKETIVNKTINYSYVLDEKEYKLIINRGKPGKSIDEIAFREDLVKSLTIIKTNKLKIKTITTEPSKLDVDVVYSQVIKEPKDAYIDKSGRVPKFVKEEAGISFDKEALRKAIDNIAEDKSVEFKLNVTHPKIKLADITWDLYNYQISTYPTYFSTTDQNRVHNLKTALNILNGKVIMPGDIFSYNAVVGSASSAQGFKAASAFVGGNIVQEVGGGICQTVSTLYNAAILANLEIVQRKNHSLPVAYVPGSRDATVYYPSIDFKFKNTRLYPIKIVTSFNAGGNLSISLHGTKEDVEPVVAISSKRLSDISYKTEYKQDSSLAKGVQVVDRNGAIGYISEAYKTVRISGNTTTTFLSKDTYKPVSKIVRIGTKVVETVKEIPVVKPVVDDQEKPVVNLEDNEDN